MANVGGAAVAVVVDLGMKGIVEEDPDFDRVENCQRQDDERRVRRRRIFD